MEEARQGGFLIAKIHQLAGRIFDRKLKKYGLSEINPAQGRILFALWQEDGISIQELAKKTALSGSTLTRMLDRLEKAGHLSRVYPRDDRRRVLIHLTEANRRMRGAYDEVSQAMTALFYQGFSADEITRFEGDLQRIYATLEGHETAAGRAGRGE